MPEGGSSLAKPLVLVVEDEAALATMLRYNLEKQGFRVDDAVDGQEALTRIAEARPDLVLLDWMLPVMSGIEVCRQLRRRSETRDLPVIMVTARTEDQDAVRGLNTGADDYITKPFSMEALLARMRALLRRANTLPAKGQLNFHDLTMHLAAHRVQRNGRPIHLGPTEFRLLEFFMQHPGRVFSREELLDAVWGPRHPRRAAHGGRAYPSPAQVLEWRWRAGRGSHGPGGGLCAGYRASLTSSS